MTGRPFPPGHYPVVVVGSGPGGIQVSHWLTRLGVDHAVISADQGPAGMFRRYPLFERLISWTKPFPPTDDTRARERFDWNSLTSDDSSLSGLIQGFMDGVSYFPARSEMEQGLVAFAEKGAVEVRYGCSWETTRRVDDGWLLETNDGEYTTGVAVFAIGMTRPWKPAQVPGIELVPHYVEVKPAVHYNDQRVVIIGKRNSGFEIADALLPHARQITLVSPRPARISILTHSVSAARARYMQPYEDHVLGGGNIVLDAALSLIERSAQGLVVHAEGTTVPGKFRLEADEVIAATGFDTPLRDLPQMGVDTFFQGRLPVQTPYWESPSAPGIYFAGSVTQGSIGLKKYGLPSSSASVHGFRYNARVLAEHLAAVHFGVPRAHRLVRPDAVVDLLLSDTSASPELWNQQSYLSRILIFEKDGGVRDHGILPLAEFVDSPGPDGLALTIETDDQGSIHPALYIRRGGHVQEHLLEPHPLHDFSTDAHRRQLESLMKGVID